MRVLIPFFCLCLVALSGCAVGGTSSTPVADDVPDDGPPPQPDLGPPPSDLGAPDLGPPDLGPPDLGPPDMGPPCGGARPCCGDGIVEGTETCEPFVIGADRCPTNPASHCDQTMGVMCLVGQPTLCNAECVAENMLDPTQTCP